ncbi:MAG: hypothetical protein ACLT4C_04420 [Butyricicoccus sp.]
MKFWWTARASTDGAATAATCRSDLLFPWRTVNENASADGDCGGISRAEMDKRAAETLEHVGLAGWGDKRPEELSGGIVSCGIRAYAADRLGTAAAQ